MSALAHTPGPWTNGSRKDEIRTESGEWIADVGGRFDTVRANARLIVAAPELLDLVRRLAHPMATDEDVDDARTLLAKLDNPI